MYLEDALWGRGIWRYGVSSIEEVLKPYFGWIEGWIGPLRMTGSHVTGNHVTGSDPHRNRKSRRYVLCMRNHFPHFSPLTIVVQNIVR